MFKTRILHKRQGFRFLGFYFIDGYAIETKGSDNTLYELNSVAANMVDSPQCEFRNNSNSIGSREKIGTILVITGEITVLSACDNKLKTVQGDKEQIFSWPTLESVVLIGPHQITTPTLRKAMSEKVQIYFATNFGLYEGVCASTCPSRGANIWLQQAALFQRAEWQLTQAKNTVLARIDGIHHLIHRRNRKWHSLEKLIRMKVRIRGAQSIDEVRGHEGQASKLLWLYFKETLDPSWQFTRRNRRPPSDPINAMLSLGYTFLYNLCDTAIQAQGLYAWHGFYHQSKTTHSALASDLMEPFRVIVERVVLTMVNRHQIKTEEFATSDSGCEMSSAARKQFLTTLLSELTQKRKREQSRYIDEIFSSPKQLVLALRQGTNTQSWRP